MLYKIVFCLSYCSQNILAHTGLFLGCHKPNWMFTKIDSGQNGLVPPYPCALKRFSFEKRYVCRWQFIRNANGARDPSEGNDAPGIPRYNFVTRWHAFGHQHLSNKGFFEDIAVKISDHDYCFFFLFEYGMISNFVFAFQSSRFFFRVHILLRKKIGGVPHLV